jgi:DNA-binding winged helix-turn-helix (wHTH) protein
MQPPFLINNRFSVHPSTNELTDAIGNQQQRVEERLMRLLCLLTENAGKTVAREDLVSRIWQNYGGGDEGLTQAISGLRKLLQDEGKQLIQTVPKKGYLFTGTITNLPTKTSIPPKRQRSKHTTKKFGIIAAALVVGLVVASFFMRTRPATPSPVPTRVDYPANLAAQVQAEENENNTVTTRGPDSTLYKLVMIGDRPPVFYVNNVKLSEGEWGPHMTLINFLKRQLAAKRAGRDN